MRAIGVDGLGSSFPVHFQKKTRFLVLNWDTNKKATVRFCLTRLCGQVGQLTLDTCSVGSMPAYIMLSFFVGTAPSRTAAGI